MTTAEQFFYKHAGFSFNPATETEEQGRTRCASELAAAEVWAAEGGYCFQWSKDPELDSSELRGDSDYSEPYALWVCVMRGDSGDVVDSLGGVDLGPGREPWGHDYRRVVEAELALEQARAFSFRQLSGIQQ